MTSKEFLHKIAKPAILIKDCKLADYNKLFAELGDVQIGVSLENLFTPNKFVSCEFPLILPENTLFKYQNEYYKLQFTELKDENFDFLIVLENVTIEPEKNYYSLYANQLHLGYCYAILDQENNIQQKYISKNILDRFAIDSQDKFFDLFLKDNFGIIIKNIQKIANTPEASFDYNFDLISAQGEKLNIFIRGFSTVIDGKKVVFCTTIDYSELNKITQKLYNTEINFAKFFENNQDPVVIAKGDKIVAFNKKAVEKAKEYNIQLEIGGSITDSLEQDEVSKIKLSQDKTNYSIETDVILNNNQRVYIELSSIPIFLFDDTYTAYIVKDLTARKKLFNELEYNKRLYENIFNSVFNGIVLVDKNGIVKFWNKSAEKILGYTANEMIGKPIYKIYSREESKQKHLQMQKLFVATGEAELINKSVTVSSRRKDGSKFYLEMVITSFKDANGEWNAVAVFQDVSEKIEWQKKIAQSHKELDGGNSALKKFFSILAHDLRTPFSQIISLSELILDNSSSFTQTEIQYYIQLLNQAAHNGDNLLGNLLEWGKTIVNNIVFNPIEFNIDDIIQRIIKIQQSRLEEKKLNINFNYGEHIITTDSNILFIIINNLLTNAIKFSYHNSPIDLSISEDEECWIIKVKDYGVGMTKEQIDALFRYDKSMKTLGTDDEKGAGIGLLLTFELVKKLNGKIWAESAENKGTTFNLKIPKKIKQEK